MAPYLETYMVILKKGDFEKKNSYKRLSEEKNCMQHKKKGKKEEEGKKILPTRILEKNDCCWAEIPPQKLNGRPLTKAHSFT